MPGGHLEPLALTTGSGRLLTGSFQAPIRDSRPLTSSRADAVKRPLALASSRNQHAHRARDHNPTRRQLEQRRRVGTMIMDLRRRQQPPSRARKAASVMAPARVDRCFGRASAVRRERHRRGPRAAHRAAS